MKRILITGANGQLGRALNHLLNNQEEYILENTDVDTLDIGDYPQVEKLIKEFMPDIIINCAAYTAVDNCESHEQEAYYINAVGPKNLALAAKEVDAKLVHVSTDYVFDGLAEKPYVETDQTNPQSAYGRTKLAGEEFVGSLYDKSFIIRTAWLYGEGNNFVCTMLRLAKEKEFINVVKDQYGTPTSALELARLIVYLMNTDQYGIYHGTCEGMTNWYEFALEIFKLTKVNIKVNPVTSAEYPSAVKRPAYSVLENHRLKEAHSYQMKNWKDALEEYLKDEVAK